MDVGGRSAAVVDDEARMLGRDARASVRVALEARIANELARKVTLRALEGRPRARKLQGLLLPATLREVIHPGTYVILVTLVQPEGRREHHESLVAHAARSIAQRELFDRKALLGPVRHEAANRLEHVGDAAPIGPRVHEAGATHRSRYPAGKLQPREPKLAGHLGGLS